METGRLMCECGARTSDGVGCEAVYHQILAAEQLDPTLGRWHTIVVCAFLLQHPSRGLPKFLDGQFRMLQLYRDQGLEALLRVAAHQRGRNRHSIQTGYDLAPLEPYTALPKGGPPDRFPYGFLDMRDLVGDFGRNDYREYGQRLDAIVEETLSAWLAENVAE